MKKILIFSSYGGGGHISATDALKEYLHEEYEIETVYIIDEVLGGIAPIKVLSFNSYSEEKFYNFCLKRKWTWIINVFYHMALYLIYFNEKVIKKIITTFIKNKKPDLVISVVPLLNNVIKESCKECNLPFLLIPTDLDNTSFTTNIRKPIYNKFLLALAFEDTDILRFAKNDAIPSEEKIITGFPIKSSFFEQKNHEQIKNDFHIPSDKPVILVLMGAAGANAMYDYLLTLLQLPLPIHLILCLGRNESLRKHIEKAHIPPHITLSIVGFTDRIADLMAVAHLCITKAGTVSVCETIYMNLPMILDNTATSLYWERFNSDFIKKHHFGAVITHYKQLNSLVIKMLTDSDYYATCKKNLESFPKKNFGNCIKQVISNLMP